MEKLHYLFSIKMIHMIDTVSGLGPGTDSVSGSVSGADSGLD